jgi:hypothetical protein
MERYAWTGTILSARLCLVLVCREAQDQSIRDAPTAEATTPAKFDAAARAEQERGGQRQRRAPREGAPEHGIRKSGRLGYQGRMGSDRARREGNEEKWGEGWCFAAPGWVAARSGRPARRPSDSEAGTADMSKGGPLIAIAS